MLAQWGIGGDGCYGAQVLGIDDFPIAETDAGLVAESLLDAIESVTVKVHFHLRAPLAAAWVDLIEYGRKCRQGKSGKNQ